MCLATTRCSGVAGVLFLLIKRKTPENRPTLFFQSDLNLLSLQISDAGAGAEGDGG